MTRKEAIRRMECCRDFLANNYSDMGEPNVTAFNMAIKALEQKPCTDAISRSAVIEALVDMRDGYPNPSGEMISDKTIVSIVNELPSVTPTHKKGHWIPTYGDVKCSVCGNFKSGRDVGRATHYSDFCGAKMESEDRK